MGVERSTLAPLAENDFQLSSSAAILSFLISFGLVKAASNLIAGGLADRFGRRTVLLAGWTAALPVPVLVILAQYVQTALILVTRDNRLLLVVAFVLVVMMGMWLRLMRHPQEA